MSLSLTVTTATGDVLAQSEAVSNPWSEIYLIYEPEYVEGDSVGITTTEPGHFIILALDDAMPPALVFMSGTSYSLKVPFGEKHMPYSTRAFAGTMHRLYARYARPEEIATRRNLAFNPYDAHGNEAIFPRAIANVETRGEAQFAARNAIDGEKANNDHGSFPFTSWGINKDPAAELTVEFGREVAVDEAIIYLRADFPHDAWWNKASLSFSDGFTIEVDLVKTGEAQSIKFPPRKVTWAKIHSMIKADDPSPYPALTLLEVWGTEA